MKKKLSLILAFMIVGATLFTSTALPLNALAQEKAQTNETSKKSTTDKTEETRTLNLTASAYKHLINDDFQSLYAMLSADIQKAASVEAIKTGWTQLLSMCGSPKELKTKEIKQENGVTTILSNIVCENANILMSTTLVKGKNKFDGFYITLETNVIEKALPDDLIEEDIILNQGTDFELKGKITLPKKATGKLPAAVLVHGSGATDMNEQAYGYMPFRDIAYGLAQQGIAVIRYDKRNYTYPEADFSTVKLETVDDAIAATNMIKSNSKVDPKRVFIVGHSQGGLLAPRIDQAGGNFAGLVIVSGTPFSIGEVGINQSTAALADKAALLKSGVTKEEIAAAQTYLDAETEKFLALSKMTDEEAKKADAIFGLEAYYLKDFMNYDALTILKTLKKPTFIMQGSADIQVLETLDYKAYQDGLKGQSWAQFKLYKGLNHFYALSSGIREEAMKEYMQPADFSPEAISDIAKFILRTK